MSKLIAVLLLPYLRILPSRKSIDVRRSPYNPPGSTMFRNWTTFPLLNGRFRPDVFTTPGMLSTSTWPLRLWLCTEGNSLPGYGRLLNVPLSSTSIFGIVYDASPFRFVFHPDSRWQKACGHCPMPPRNVSRNPPVPPQGPKM